MTGQQLHPGHMCPMPVVHPSVSQPLLQGLSPPDFTALSLSRGSFGVWGSGDQQARN